MQSRIRLGITALASATLAQVRALVIHEGDEIDADALKALIRSAVELNTAAKS